jgi:hypothetical protein
VKQVLITLICLVILIALIVQPVPIVEVSNSTGKCVQVIPEGDCNNLPSRYTIDYVF